MSIPAFHLNIDELNWYELLLTLANVLKNDHL